MNNFKLRITVICLSALALIGLGIFAFIRLSLVDVPMSKCVKKDVQKLPIAYSEIANILKWNNKVLVSLSSGMANGKLYVLESNNQLVPFHRLSADCQVRTYFVDKFNRLIVEAATENSQTINIFSEEKDLVIDVPLFEKPLYNEFGQFCGISPLRANVPLWLFTTKNFIFADLNGSDDIKLWDISGSSPKPLQSIRFHKLDKPPPMPAYRGSETNFWSVIRCDDQFIYFLDCLGNQNNLDFKTMKAQVVPCKAITPENVKGRHEIIQYQSYRSKQDFKDKSGKIWRISDLNNPAQMVDSQIDCIDNGKIVFTSRVKGSRDGSHQGSWVENIFSQFHFHVATESVNWNYPPTNFRQVFFDNSDRAILRTDSEGFFRFQNDKWVRLSSPTEFNLLGPYLENNGKVILSNSVSSYSSVPNQVCPDPKILTYDLNSNTFESLELSFATNCPTIERESSLVGYPVENGRVLRMESVKRFHPRQVYPGYYN